MREHEITIDGSGDSCARSSNVARRPDLSGADREAEQRFEREMLAAVHASADKDETA